MLRWDALPDALALDGPEVVSFVGGGGKTTALFALARYRPGSCIITTTTKMGADRTGDRPVLLDPTDDEVADAVRAHRSVIVWASSDGQRAFGVDPDACGRWSTLADTVAVEADGSRRRPFKAPLAYEPVVPAATSVLVACVGMAAIGAPIGAGCHRPERVAELVGSGVDDLLTPERLVRVLTATDGSRKGRPPNARYAVLVNRVTAADEPVVTEIGERLAAIDPAVPLLAMADITPDRLPDAG